MPNHAQGQQHTKSRLKYPSQYQVIMHNDDFTTMEFVVKVLVTVFHKSEADAQSLMLKVHYEGKACVGIFSFDVAATKVSIATDMARKEGFPFNMTIEPFDELPF